MIVDAHCHAWPRWPYPAKSDDVVPDSTAEGLVAQMDGSEVGAALVVGAEIDPGHDDTAYLARSAARWPGRLHVLADLDSSWSDSYQTDGAADRLRHLLDSHPLAGFTHYPSEDAADDAGWLASDAGLELFRLAERRGLLASVASLPHQLAAVQMVAAVCPDLPILVHHLGMLTAADTAASWQAREVAACAALPNIVVKVSGFAYASTHLFPYDDARWIVEFLLETFGARRLVWGSDYPVVTTDMSYPQSLQVARAHLDQAGASDDETRRVFGGTMLELLSCASSG